MRPDGEIESAMREYGLATFGEAYAQRSEWMSLLTLARIIDGVLAKRLGAVKGIDPVSARTYGGQALTTTDPAYLTTNRSDY